MGEHEQRTVIPYMELTYIPFRNMEEGQRQGNMLTEEQSQQVIRMLEDIIDTLKQLSKTVQTSNK